MANVQLLQDTLNYIKNHPDEWYQSSWYAHFDADSTRWFAGDAGAPCRTAYCFAGTAAILSGFPPPPKEHRTIWSDENGVQVDEYAEKALGLTYSQAVELFHASNTLEDLEEMVAKIIENPEIDGLELAPVF